MPEILTKQEPLVTIDDFVNTYENQQHDEANKAVEFLETKGVLPLTYTNPLLPDMNIILAWLFWSGFVSDYKGMIHAKMGHHRGIEEVAERLELELKPSKEYETHLMFSTHGAWYARVFNVLGIHNSDGTREDVDRQVKRVTHLPNYVRFLASNHRYLHGADREIANKILIDQCKVALLSKYSDSGTTPKLKLFKNNERKSIEIFSKEILRLFNSIYPKIGLDGNSVHIYQRKGNLWDGEIFFTMRDIFNSVEFYPLFNMSISINPSYHEMGRRPTYGG